MYHLLLVISAVGAAVAVAAFLSNRAARDEINASLAIKGLTAPERATSYDAADLRAVAKYLKSQRSSDNRTLLDVYIRPVLMWNDIVFAVALSIFSGVLWVWLIVHFQLAGLLLVLVAAAAASAIL